MVENAETQPIRQPHRTIRAFGEVEEIIKKSRFIGRAKPVTSEEEAIQWIKEIRAAERDATHHCTCYALGDRLSTQRYDDDGEPQGTAGIPMLEVLKKEEITDTCVIVTRYFGGVKLGASGLVRAYGSVCKSAIDAAGIVRMTAFVHVKIEVQYTSIGRIDYVLRQSGYDEIRRDFGASVTIELYVAETAFPSFVDTIEEETSGSAKVTRVASILLPVDAP